MAKYTSIDLKPHISVVNQGKVRVELVDPSTNRVFYVSPFITAPLYKRMMKEKPFMAFLEIKKYTITAKVVEVQSDSIVIEWSYDGLDKFMEVETHHPLLWEVALQKMTDSVTE